MQPDREKIKAREVARDTYWSEYDQDSHPCQDCADSEKPLEVHHIDQDPFNNKLSNLVGLCHACHMRRHRKDAIESRLTEMRIEAEAMKT